jgi:hypothetical protein
VEALPEVSGATFFFFSYIGWTGHSEAVGEVSRANFFLGYIGRTDHVYSINEVSGASNFGTYVGW